MKRLIFSTTLLLSFTILFAQKKPLDHSVYDGWQSIGERMISNDGRWVVYTINAQEGDNELVIQSSDATYKKVVPRGYNATITEDSRYAVFKIKAFFADTREAKIKKKKGDDMPKDSFAIVELGKDSVWKQPKVKNYKTPDKEAGWVAYHLEKAIDKKEMYVAGYQKGFYRIMFGHPMNVAHGLTLTKGTRTVWASPTHDLEWFTQGSRRQYRMGQTKKTETVVIVAKDTYDERAYANLLGKNVRMTNLLDLFGQS